MKFSPSTCGFYCEAVNGTNIPADAVEISHDQYLALLVGQTTGKRIVADDAGHPCLTGYPAKSSTEIIADYEAALDAHLDMVAQQHRYNDRLTFALRSGYPNPWQADGIKFGTWMDSCNAQAFALLESVLAGETELPSKEDFIASLPEFVL